MTTRIQRSKRRNSWRRRPDGQRGFLLLMVLLVVSIIALSSLNFSESMLTAHQAANINSQRFQARMMVESGIQVARVYAAESPATREESGGSWDNPQKFQAINVIANIDPVLRGNVSFIAPSLDQSGAISSYRFGMQNESAKLNLNALVQLDKISQSLSSAGSALSGLAGAAGAGGAGGLGGAGGGGASGGAGGGASGGGAGAPGGGGQLTGPGGPNSRGGGGAAFGSATFSQSGSAGSAGSSSLSSAAGADGSSTPGIGSQMLLGIPGMTEDVADAILDFLDEDEDTRPYGCEYADYYQQLQPSYRPLNGPLTSIEQLLLVRGVTPQLLYGYDQNRNGVLDSSEQMQMAMGGQVGGMPGAAPTASTTNSSTTSTDGTQLTQPSPMGWSSYLTLHSQERNVDADGAKRVNINSDDLQQLKADLETAGVNELFSSYIIGYRLGGQPPPGAGSPLQTLMTAAATTSGNQSGVLGQQIAQAVSQTQQQGQGQGQNQPGQGQQQKKPWTSSALGEVDLATAKGSVKFNQVLDLIGSSVTISPQGGAQGQQQGGQQQGGQPQAGQQAQAYNSPIEDNPLALSDALPILMDKLTTVDAPALPGRINIMECPREILAGIPGLSDEVVESILQARADGSQTENRKFETWLAVEGLVTIDQMRGFLPLMTCGGDVFKAQVIGYFEGSSAFARVEAIISGVESVPKVLFIRRLDHLGRGFDVTTLGQRMDVGSVSTAIKR